MDQRVYCSGGSFYDRPAGMAEYHAEHNHVHYNDYANYILEPADGGLQNPRQGSKTTFLHNGYDVRQSAAARRISERRLRDVPDGRIELQCARNVRWLGAIRTAADLAGQSLFIGDLAPGSYRLRHVFDPAATLLETQDNDNESCELVEIGDGANEALRSGPGSVRFGRAADNFEHLAPIGTAGHLCKRDDHRCQPDP